VRAESHRELSHRQSPQPWTKQSRLRAYDADRKLIVREMRLTIRIDPDRLREFYLIRAICKSAAFQNGVSSEFHSHFSIRKEPA
jgi:hypothetical protein